MKSIEQARYYEFTPFRMFIPSIPIPADEALPEAPDEDDEECHWPRELPIVGAYTRPTCAERAKREAEELLRRCRRRLRCGDRSAIVELLDLNPEFICVRWVREELLRLVEGGLSLRKPGRPSGRYKMHPLLVVGLVEHLIATKRVPNAEQAFLKLYELRVLSYEAARECYYRGLRDKRFAAVLMEFPEGRQVVPEEVARPLLEATEVVQPGKKSVRRWEDPRLGTVDFVIEGR